MQNKKTFLIKGIIISLILLFLIGRANKIFIKNNIRIKRWDAFYKIPKNELDVIFMGSSHSYATYNPKIIDNKLGINSFNLASNSQGIDQLYFNLKEVLKYQKPSYVFVELFSSASAVRKEVNYQQYDNLDGQNLSLNKIRSIKAYMPKNAYVNSLFPFVREHENWSNPKLLISNIKRYREEDEYNKSLLSFDGFQPGKTIMSEETTKKYIIEKKQSFKNYKYSDSRIEYLKKIKKLSEKYGFKIIYVYSPMYREYISSTYSYKYEYQKLLAQKYADDYLDFNYLGEKIGLSEKSFTNEYSNIQHTSKIGATQISNYVAEYLKGKLESRVGEEYWKRRNTGYKELHNESLYQSSKVILFKNEYFEISKISNTLYYIPLTKEVYDMRFFLHIVPKNNSDLPQKRRQYNFENLDFSPTSYTETYWDNEKKIYVKPLPDYELKSVRTGQFNKDGRLWECKVNF